MNPGSLRFGRHAMAGVVHGNDAADRVVEKPTTGAGGLTRTRTREYIALGQLAEQEQCVFGGGCTAFVHEDSTGGVGCCGAATVRRGGSP